MVTVVGAAAEPSRGKARQQHYITPSSSVGFVVTFRLLIREGIENVGRRPNEVVSALILMAYEITVVP